MPNFFKVPINMSDLKQTKPNTHPPKEVNTPSDKHT